MRLVAATINRHDFNTGTGKLSIDRDNYQNAANIIIAQQACANVAAAASIDTATRQLTLKVKVYYTGNGTGTSNKLNVALIQDGILGTQTGASNNPSQVVGNQYIHNELFHHFITGQWGEDISPVTQGTLIEKEYSYRIPALFFDRTNNNNVRLVLRDLRLIVFVAEGQTEVINVCEAPISYK